MNNYPIIIHGSENSLDKDAYVIINAPLENKDAKSLCSEYRELNANLLVVTDGVVSWSYKGTKDECNNSIIHTYALHQQSFDNPISKLVERDYALKMLRTIRGLLSYVSRTEYRVEVKKALVSEDLGYKLEVLSKIDFSKIADFEKSSVIETYKFFAFQMGQTKALLQDNLELFTKNSVAQYYPTLEKYLKREESNVSDLNDFYIGFVEYMKTQYKKVERHSALFATNFHGKKEVVNAKLEKTMPPVVVFDMDGTLFDESHRKEHRENGDLDTYFKLCHLDKPIASIVNLVHEYKSKGYEIWIMTGRSVSCEQETIQSLQENGIPYDFLKMRAIDNHIPDYVLKPAWIGKYIGKERVDALYDDTDAVLDGFKAKGLNSIDVKLLNTNTVKNKVV